MGVNPCWSVASTSQAIPILWNSKEFALSNSDCDPMSDYHILYTNKRLRRVYALLKTSGAPGIVPGTPHTRGDIVDH